MSGKKQIIIFSKNKSIEKLLQDNFSTENFDLIYTSTGKDTINLVKKNKPLILIVEQNIENKIGTEFLLVTNKISKSTESIFIGRNITTKQLLSLINENAIGGVLLHPFDGKEFLALIENMLKKNAELSETKETLSDMFESYNQIEFLLTMLLNDYESYTDSLELAIDLFGSSKLTHKQEMGSKLLNDLHFNNTRLVERFNNLRMIGDIQESNFKKIDIVDLIIGVINILKDENQDFKLKLPNNLLTGQFFVKASEEELKILFREVFYSISLSMVEMWKSINISIRKSEILENLEGKGISSIEIEIQSSLETSSATDSSLIESTSQQFGFGYFLMKSIVDSFNGKILLKDIKKEKETTTQMIIVLPEYK